jgi:hypothetical protein
MTMTTSRRAILAGAATLPVLSVPAVAAIQTEPDPIFAAIERHRSAYAEWVAALDYETALEHELPSEKRRSDWSRGVVNTDDPRWIDNVVAIDKWHDEKAAAMTDLVTVSPTTAAGVLALLKYYAETAPLDAKTYWPDAIDDEAYERDEEFGTTLVRHAVAAFERIIRSEA